MQNDTTMSRWHNSILSSPLDHAAVTWADVTAARNVLLFPKSTNHYCTPANMTTQPRFSPHPVHVHQWRHRHSPEFFNCDTHTCPHHSMRHVVFRLPILYINSWFIITTVALWHGGRFVWIKRKVTMRTKINEYISTINYCIRAAILYLFLSREVPPWPPCLPPWLDGSKRTSSCACLPPSVRDSLLHSICCSIVRKSSDGGPGTEDKAARGRETRFTSGEINHGGVVTRPGARACVRTYVTT